MTNNRKRPRNNKDEGECLPLSKRINNLHINNRLMFENQQGHSQNPMQVGPGPPSYDMPQINDPSENHQYPQQMPNYSPELDESQNPHYFNINKLLYEMYLERSRRETR
ncbi:uncharacterized protein LOC123316805 [Coccinella septempunctata]|uniref:uncharacterized protein LOC123316805 n=1 Tax=Coccinella septempunctata TaxID=41139 RepID=UPI001D0797A1|nr:uncharacterized protein LOC123316805 [Coccinella septempunctata]